MLVTLAMALVALGLTACFPPPPGTPTAITTEPALFPAFQTGITNYVIRCDPNTPVAVHVTTPNGTLVSVARKYPRGGIFGEYVNQSPGERFTIEVNTDPSRDVITTYNVRCLPTDFPQFDAQPAPYGLTPFFMTGPLAAFDPMYTAIYDRQGVPLWWSDPQFTVFSTLLPNGNVGTMIDGGVEERRLDGTLVRTVKTVGGPADQHDMLLLPNGHFVMVTVQPKEGVDLTAIGGPASASVCNHVVQEVDPDTGAVVWSWDTSDHIPVTEMDPQWYASFIAGGPGNTGCGYDVYHWNAIEPTGTGFILSFRHLDAVYDIDQATGNLVWKLGGSARPESLTVDDPVFNGGSHFGGQHDSRLQADGTVTVYDDGTDLGRAPRAVRYAIDLTARTATLVDAVTDAQVPASFCCGSARHVGSGVWVVGWGGGNPVATETVGSIRQFTLSFPGLFVYRLIPLTTSQVSVPQLVDAMDARFANPSANAASPSDPGDRPYPP